MFDKRTYRGLLPFDLLDALVLHGVHFGADKTGVVFHLMGCLSEHGKVGATSVASTVEGARALHDRTVQVLDALAGSTVAIRETNSVGCHHWKRSV